MRYAVTKNLLFGFILAFGAGGCGATSSGLLSDSLVCKTAADSLAGDVAAIDAQIAATETNVVIPAADASSSQPALAQNFMNTSDQYYWGVAIKLVAPTGLDGDVKVELLDNNSAPSSSPYSYASKTIPAAEIGYTPTWLLVDFGQFVTLSANRTYRLGVSGLYSVASTRRATWATIGAAAGESLDQFVPASIDTPATFTPTGRTGIFLLQRCQ